MNKNSASISSQPTLNPYRSALAIPFALLKQRIPWDLKAASWSSRKKLRNIKDTSTGKKAVILCNGPSLLKVDFELLKDSGVYCFGLNKINLLFEKVAFRPASIVSVNPFVIEQNIEYFNSTNVQLFLDSDSHSLVKGRENVVFLHSAWSPKFARDCSVSIYKGVTVTFVALELAYHMGFSEVAIVGCDHSFSTGGPAHKVVRGGESDPNHFDPRYFAGKDWQLPDLAGSEVNYQMALENYEAAGRKLVNATEGGRLELLPRQDLRDFLKA